MRISGKGLIDAHVSVPFSFDGQRYCGRAGDTLASALMANEVRLIGRSFKYHRPRGVMTAGPEEPNALVTLKRGSALIPNTRATTQELYEGLVAQSQNAWPSLRHDLLAFNDAAAPFLSSGFYYKTFMWPRPFWKSVYEPLIRRAAGLGALSGQPDDSLNDKAFSHCDVLVIGAGPAGLMAALAAARAGAEVILAEQDSRCGGRLLAEREEVATMAGADWAAQIAAELEAMDNVRVMVRTTVVGAYDQGTYGALERVSHHLADAPEGCPLETFWRIHAKRAVLCAGALERPIAFANNDRPGVMMASAVRAYLNRWGVAPGRRVAIFGNNDDAHRTARDLTAAGVEVAALIDARKGVSLDVGVPVHEAGRVTATRGRLGLRSITVQTAAGSTEIEVDCLALSGGWNPTLHLTSHMGARPIWREDIAAFVPRENAVPGLAAAGAAAGDFSTQGCLSSGLAAGRDAVTALGLKPARLEAPQAEDGTCAVTPLWVVPGKGRAWLDFMNDVTVKDVALSARENLASVEHMKRFTTQGMAPDQGKNSNVNALAVLADVTGRSIPETGTTTFRPPFAPVAIAALGAGGGGSGFAPQRFTTSHGVSVALGAPMIEAVLWYRPSFFPRAGERTWRQSCDREVGMVRENVGICDVSTLGKIDIQGRDAGAFLD